METIADHEFVENQQGELVLLLNTISDNVPLNPVFLVSPTELHGYLRRRSDSSDIHQIVGINPTVIDKVRKISSFLVIEMTDDDARHGYHAVTALYEGNE